MSTTILLLFLVYYINLDKKSNIYVLLVKNITEVQYLAKVICIPFGIAESENKHFGD